MKLTEISGSFSKVPVNQILRIIVFYLILYIGVRIITLES